MNNHLNTEKLKKHSLLYRLTAVIFMIITLDSAYIYLTVRKMAVIGNQIAENHGIIVAKSTV